MKNINLRNAIKEARLNQWQVAETYGLHEGNFSRLLRKELSDEQKQKIYIAIEKAKNIEK